MPNQLSTKDVIGLKLENTTKVCIEQAILYIFIEAIHGLTIRYFSCW